MVFRRRRFADVVERQLDLFAKERAGLIADAAAALRAYDAADREEAEARYGDYLDLVDTGQDQLVEIREAYATTLDEATAEDYRAAFTERVRKRLPQFGLELD